MFTLIRLVIARHLLPLMGEGRDEGHKNISKYQILVVIFFFGIFTAGTNSFSQDYPSKKTIAIDTTTASHKDTSLTTLAPVKHDSLQADTALKAGKRPDSLQIVKKQGIQTKSVPAADTISRFLTHPYFGVGIGWGLGSFPILSEWQNAVPDSVGAILPLNPDTLGFKITEPVNTYNILFPIYISYTPFIYRKSSVAFDASFYYIGKSLQATLQKDTFPEKVDYQQSMNCFGFSAGVFYRHQIDERYFKIDKVDRTSFIFGLSVIPYVHVSKSESISSSGVSDSVVFAASSRLRNFSAWGAGGGWRIGISSQQSLSATSGMEVSLSYIGRYMGAFRKNGGYLLNKDIDPSADDPDSKVSSLSSTVEIRLDFEFGKRQKNESK